MIAHVQERAEFATTDRFATVTVVYLERVDPLIKTRYKLSLMEMYVTAHTTNAYNAIHNTVVLSKISKLFKADKITQSQHFRLTLHITIYIPPTVAV